MLFFKNLLLILFIFIASPLVAAEVRDPGATGYYDASQISALRKPDPETLRRIQKTLARLPITFEKHIGENAFFSRNQNYNIWISPTALTLTFNRKSPSKSNTVFQPIQMKLRDANQDSTGSGLEEAVTKTNYLMGNDRSKWRTDVPNYSKVKYENVYPDIDLVYYDNQGTLEYDFVVKPGSDYKAINLKFKGIERLSLDNQGNLLLETSAGSIMQKAPVIYQEIDGQRQFVKGGYVLEDNQNVRFQVAQYDPQSTLVIDPELEVFIPYSTFIGDHAFDEGISIGITDNGEIVIAGNSSSNQGTGTLGAFQVDHGGGLDVFVTKLNRARNAVEFSTWIGGVNSDKVSAMEIGGQRIFLTGTTESPNFPIKPGAFQENLQGNSDAFFVTLNSKGSDLESAHYFGGAGNEIVHDMALISPTSLAIVGETTSSFASFRANTGPDLGPGTHGFLVKIDLTGFPIRQFIGGSGVDRATGVAASGNSIYVTGDTSSSDLSPPPDPGSIQHVSGGTTSTTPGSFQTNLSGLSDAFVIKFNSRGEPQYSTYLGGTGEERAPKIVTDTNGNAYIAGETTSFNFPFTSGAYDTTYNGGNTDNFVTKLNPVGTELVFSTFIGGGEDDFKVGSVFLDNDNSVYVVTQTTSADFPVALSQNPVFGNGDAILYQLVEEGKVLLFSIYLSGNFDDRANDGIVRGNSAFIVGSSNSTNLNGGVNALQPNKQGDSDAYITEFKGRFVTPAPPALPTPAPPNIPVISRNIAAPTSGPVNITSLPFIIVSPGNYKVVGNLSINSGNAAAIHIRSPNVTLSLSSGGLRGDGCDCNGILVSPLLTNTIDNGDNFTSFPLNQQLTNVKIIGPGSITGFGKKGIISVNPLISSTSFLDNTTISINNLKITGNSEGGINLEGRNHQVTNTSVANNGGTGIIVGINSTVNRNNVRVNGGAGILTGNNATIDQNNVSVNSGSGIVTPGTSTITRNNVLSNLGSGIVAGPSSTVRTNVAIANQLSGIEAGPFGLVTGNNVQVNNTSGSVGHGNLSLLGGVTASNNAVFPLGIHSVGQNFLE